MRRRLHFDERTTARSAGPPAFPTHVQRFPSRRFPRLLLPLPVPAGNRPFRERYRSWTTRSVGNSPLGEYDQWRNRLVTGAARGACVVTGARAQRLHAQCVPTFPASVASPPPPATGRCTFALGSHLVRCFPPCPNRSNPRTSCAIPVHSRRPLSPKNKFGGDRLLSLASVQLHRQSHQASRTSASSSDNVRGGKFMVNGSGLWIFPGHTVRSEMTTERGDRLGPASEGRETVTYRGRPGGHPTLCGRRRILRACAVPSGSSCC